MSCNGCTGGDSHTRSCLGLPPLGETAEEKKIKELQVELDSLLDMIRRLNGALITESEHNARLTTKLAEAEKRAVFMEEEKDRVVYERELLQCDLENTTQLLHATEATQAALVKGYERFRGENVRLEADLREKSAEADSLRALSEANMLCRQHLEAALTAVQLSHARLEESLQRVLDQDRVRGYPTGSEWLAVVALVRAGLTGEGK